MSDATMPDRLRDLERENAALRQSVREYGDTIIKYGDRCAELQASVEQLEREARERECCEGCVHDGTEQCDSCKRCMIFHADHFKREGVGGTP